MHATGLPFAIYQMPAPTEIKQTCSFHISVLFDRRKQTNEKVKMKWEGMPQSENARLEIKQENNTKMKRI